MPFPGIGIFLLHNPHKHLDTWIPELLDTALFFAWSKEKKPNFWAYNQQNFFKYFHWDFTFLNSTYIIRNIKNLSIKSQYCSENTPLSPEN